MFRDVTEEKKSILLPPGMLAFAAGLPVAEGVQAPQERTLYQRYCIDFIRF
jgi:hypothetical protein